MDGTDFNLNVDLIDCNRSLKLEWVSSLKDTIIKESGKSLFLDSTNFRIPRNNTFELFLYNELGTEILYRDILVVEFMTVNLFFILKKIFFLNFILKTFIVFCKRRKNYSFLYG
jgi:hypothetical protein